MTHPYTPATEPNTPGRFGFWHSVVYVRVKEERKYKLKPFGSIVLCSPLSKVIDVGHLKLTSFFVLLL